MHLSNIPTQSVVLNCLRNLIGTAQIGAVLEPKSDTDQIFDTYVISAANSCLTHNSAKY